MLKLRPVRDASSGQAFFVAPVALFSNVQETRSISPGVQARLRFSDFNTQLTLFLTSDGVFDQPRSEAHKIASLLTRFHQTLVIARKPG